MYWNFLAQGFLQICTRTRNKKKAFFQLTDSSDSSISAMFKTGQVMQKRVKTDFGGSSMATNLDNVIESVKEGACKKSTQNCTDYKKAWDQNSSEDSSNSSVSLSVVPRSRFTISHLPNAIKLDKTNEKIKLMKNSQVMNSVTSKNKHNDTTSIESTILTKQDNQANGREQDAVKPNFKFCMMKITEDLKYMLSKFKLQVNHLQLKYLMDETVSEQNATDMMSFYNDMINELKENLVEEEQNSKNVYHHWKMKYNLPDVLNEQSNQHVNVANIQAETKENAQSSSDEEIFSPNYKPKEMTNNIKNNSKLLKNGSLTLHSNTNKDTNEQPLERNNTFTFKTKNISSNNNIMSESEQNLTLNSHKLKEITVTKKPAIDSVMRIKVIRDIASDLKELNQKYKEAIKHCNKSTEDSLTKETAIETNLLPDNNSDVSSTCSTVALFPLKAKNMQESEIQKDDAMNVDKNRNVCESNSPNSNSNLKQPNEIQSTSLHRCQSVETVIIGSNTVTNYTEQDSKYKKNIHKLVKPRVRFSFPDNEELSFRRQLKSIVPDVNKLSTNHCLRSVQTKNRVISTSSSKPVRFYDTSVDKKLYMNCQVLMKKLRSTR